MSPTVAVCRCVCVIRPESVGLLCGELARPRYLSYHVYTTNTLPRQVVLARVDTRFGYLQAVKQLAEADTGEAVRELRELYLDFLPVGPHLFGWGLARPLQPLGSRWEEASLTRATQVCPLPAVTAC